MIVRCAGPNGHEVLVDSDRVQTLEYGLGRCTAQLEDGARLDYGLPNARKLYETLATAVTGREPENVQTIPYEAERPEARRDREQQGQRIVHNAPGHRQDPGDADAAAAGTAARPGADW
jgi:hypothetical protein